MLHQVIKNFLDSAISSTAEHISQFVARPGKDFTRRKKLPENHLISFLISQGSSSTKNELLDFYSMDKDAPSNSAFSQQRAKLNPDALRDVFLNFNQSVNSLYDCPEYRYLAADGSTFAFFSKPEFCPDDYFVSAGHSAKGFYNMHLNAFYDLERHTYTDAVIQPVHQKDEFKAFCEMVDRHEIIPGCKNIYIGDRGYCSYNNMAHVNEQQQHFLFRTKDIHSKGLVGNFEFPTEDSFDITVTVTLVRSHSKKWGCQWL